MDTVTSGFRRSHLASQSLHFRFYSRNGLFWAQETIVLRDGMSLEEMIIFNYILSGENKERVKY